jgi:tRNA pseudouridine38-40 synthase
MRYFLRLSFNGKDYHGWQIQDNAHSVQGELNRALSLLLGKNVETIGCGRTDTGVHAAKFFVHFDTEEIGDEGRFVYKLNSILPGDIAIQSVFPVEDDSHARFSALSRTYIYRVYETKDPFLRDRAYFFSHQPDIVRMNNFAALLKNYTDFSCFSKSRTQTFTNNCVIKFAEWKRVGAEILFTIKADRFLRNMVRAIVGTLLEAGIDKLDEEGFIRILESKDRSEAGVSVPAHGLYLVDIEYPFEVEPFAAGNKNEND